MKTVLVTGFEPFDGDARNPSQEIARALHGREILGRSVVGAVLPCVFGTSVHTLRALLRAHRPELVVCFGVANGRTEITPERVAINVDDARIADNAGNQPVDARVARNGPVAYWSRLPIKAIVAALRAGEYPASVSQTAGTFVCNHVFYGLMHALRWQTAVRGGFIHVPGLPGMKGTTDGGWPLERTLAAAELCVETAIRVRRDVRHGGGTVA